MGYANYSGFRTVSHAGPCRTRNTAPQPCGRRVWTGAGRPPYDPFANQTNPRRRPHP